MKKTPHMLVFLILVPLLIILAGGYAYGVWKISALQKDTDFLKADILANGALLQSSGKKTADEKMEESADLSKLEGFFIKEGEEFVLIQTVEKICAGVQVACDIKPIAIEDNPNLPAEFHALHLTVSAQGTFKNVYQFASALENLPYHSTISHFSLQSGGVDTFPSSSSTSGSARSWKGDFDIHITTLK